MQFVYETAEGIIGASACLGNNGDLHRMTDKNTTNSKEDFRPEWRPRKGVNWDWIQRMKIYECGC